VSRVTIEQATHAELIETGCLWRVVRVRDRECVAIVRRRVEADVIADEINSAVR